MPAAGISRRGWLLAAAHPTTPHRPTDNKINEVGRGVERDNKIGNKHNKPTTQGQNKMGMLDITAKDAMRGVTIDPAGWYTVRIDLVGENVPSKDGQSENIIVEGTILKNADNPDDKRFENYPTPFWLFNSKAPGFAVGFLRAGGHEIVPGRVNLKMMEGQVIDAFIKNEEYQGRINSKIDHQYRPVRS